MDSDQKRICDYTVSMTIAIDVREACAPQRTGKGQWTFGFVSELLTTDHRFILFTDRALPTEWKHLAKQSTVIVRLIDVRGIKWHLRVARELKADASIDVYVSPVSYIVPFLVRSATKVIPIVHDLIAFRREPHDRKATIIERLTLKTALKQAHAVGTVSETTKHDLINRYSWLKNKKITAVYAAPIIDASADHSDATTKTILCIGTLCPRKNQLRLIRAFNSLSDADRDGYELVLIGGRGWQDGNIVHTAQHSAHVTWKKYVSSEELSRALSSASILAMPSLYEGFGLPIIEAMRAGVPVLTSNIGSMKEVAGDAAVLVDPTKERSIADGLNTLMHDDERRKKLSTAGKKRAEQFTWKKSVDIFLGLLS